MQRLSCSAGSLFPMLFLNPAPAANSGAPSDDSDRSNDGNNAPRGGIKHAAMKVAAILFVSFTSIMATLLFVATLLFAYAFETCPDFFGIVRLVLVNDDFQMENYVWVGFLGKWFYKGKF